MVPPVPSRAVPFPGIPQGQRTRCVASRSIAASYGTDTWSTHQCGICHPDAAEVDAFRQLGNHLVGYKWALNVCSTVGWNTQLCMQRMMPQGATAHSNGAWSGFCPGCYRRRPHCTSCGILGRGRLSWSYGECSGNDAPVPSLWPCWPEGGCDNLLCSSCGTASDGCHNHQRQQQCRLWYPQWGDRRLCSVAKSATFPRAPCNVGINPPQLDAPPFVVEAAAGIPLKMFSELVQAVFLTQARRQ